MRRKDKQIKQEHEIKQILQSNKVLRLGLSYNDIPYIVPMNYAYEAGYIFLHCANEGKKLQIIDNNDNCCFEITDSVNIIGSQDGCNCTTEYASVIGFGKIERVLEKSEKEYALKSLIRQILGKESYHMSDGAIDEVSVLKITIDTLTGKRSKATTA